MLMLAKNSVAFGIYSSRAEAEGAVEELKSEGYKKTNISVLFANKEISRGFTALMHAHASDEAIKNLATGALIGGTFGWLAGIGMLAIPGVGPFIAAGPIMALNIGSGFLGISGGITGALIGAGILQHHAEGYEGRIKKGAIFLSVHSNNPASTMMAGDILKRTGARDISSTLTMDAGLGALVPAAA